MYILLQRVNNEYFISFDVISSIQPRAALISHTPSIILIFPAPAAGDLMPGMMTVIGHNLL